MNSVGPCILSTFRTGSASWPRQPGLPVIKFHAARHTAATLALEAGVDVKIVAEQLGHSTTRITQDLYQNVRLQVHQDSAEKVRQLLPERIKRAQIAHS